MIRFHGFQPHDFHTSVRGSHWRHRRALGGQLRQRLRRMFGHRYQTWGLPGTNTMHIARRRVYRFPPGPDFVRLFISAGPHFLRWGIQMPMGGPGWQRFVQAMQRLPMLTWCLHLFAAHGMELSDLADDRGGVLGGCWRFEKDELIWRQGCAIPRTALAAEIGTMLRQIGDRPRAQLALYIATTPADAISWQEDAIEYVLPGLAALVPLYEWWIEQGRAPSADRVDAQGIDQT